jgi:hypothetical protein
MSRSAAFLLVLSLTILVLTLAGCGGATASPTPAPVRTDTPPATPEPPTPTPLAPASAKPAPPGPLPTFTPAPTPVPDVLYVDPDQLLGAISPYVYGANYGPWVSLRPETLPLAKEMGLTLLRWPGGEWGDKNDIQPYQLDTFVALARELGAEPYINVRMPGGSPEQAADLVRYANNEKGYNIRFWGIGNEPSLYEYKKGWEEWDTAYYNEQWPKFAGAMRAVDPNILILGPEIHQYTGNPATDPKDSQGRDWMTEFLKANGDKVDIVAIHRYPFPVKEGVPTTVEELLANPPEWDTIIPNLRRAIRTNVGRDLPIAVTEINSDWTHAIQGEATPDSFANAIWWADVLGRMIRHKVDVVTYFILVTRDEQGGYGLLEGYGPRPTYYVYELYKRFGNQQVYASSGDPEVSIYAATRPDEVLTLLVVNRSGEEKRLPLWLQNFNVEGSVQIWRLDETHGFHALDPVAMENGDPIALPPRSASLYHLVPACTQGKHR